jgi:hypothetical protein
MGSTIGAAHKVFVVKPERKKNSNFGKSFGGSHLYNHRDIMVVVVFILVKICEISNLGLSSH